MKAHYMSDSIFRILSVILLGYAAAMLSACGGGGGGDRVPVVDDSTSISISANALSFTAVQGAASPAAQTVTVSYVGDGVLVGSLPGQQIPPWLSVTARNQVTTQQSVFNVSVSTFGMAVGTYSTTIRFVTGRADGSATRTADLSITIIVAEPFGATAPTLTFTEIDGDPAGTLPSAGFTAQIRGDNIAWRAVGTQSWIAFDATSGSAKGPLVIRVNRQALPVGTHTAQVQVIDDRSVRTITFPITYTIRAAKLTVNRTSLTYNVTPATIASELNATVQVSDEIDGANSAKAVQWTASTNKSWLSVSAPSGNTSPPKTLTVSVDIHALESRASGNESATLTFNYIDSTGAGGTTSIPVTLTVRLPFARTSTPYLLAPSTPTTVIVRGEDFQDADLPLLRLDYASLTTPPTRVDSTTLTLNLPSLPAGRHAISFATGLGFARSAAEVTAKAAAPLAASFIASAHAKRLVYDAGRARLYAIDRIDQEIERYEWNGTAWNALASISIPIVKDAALNRTGSELIIAAGQALYSLDIENDATIPALLVGSPSPMPINYSWDILNYIGILDSGLALVAQTYAGSGHTSLLGYDTIRRQFISGGGSGGRFYEGRLAVSADGHYGVIGGYGLSPCAEAALIDSRGNPANVFGKQLFYPCGNVIDIDLSQDGSKILENFSIVRDRTGVQLSPALPYPSFSRIARDGTKAYLFQKSPAPGKVEIYDLTVSPYAKTGEVALTSRVISPTADLYTYPNGLYLLSGLVTPDGRSLIISGDEGIAIVPLP